MAVVIRMPEVLTGATEASLSEWLVRPGDEIAVGQPIAEVETDKATVEYAAEVAGTLAGTLVEIGVNVAVGTPIAVLAGAGESAEEALAQAGAQIAQPEPGAGPAGERATTAVPAGAGSSHDGAPAAEGAGGGGRTRLFASPLVRRIAREKGLDLSAVRGTGPGGRIVRRDVEGREPAAPAAQGTAAAAVGTLAGAAGETRASGTPGPAASGGPHRPVATGAPIAAGGYTDVPHTGMRRAIARRLTESKSTVPHYYLTAHCRVDALLELRRTINDAGGQRISVNDLVVKAVAAAFREVPEANAVWTEEAVRRFEDVDVAVAVAVADGLLTPVVRAVDKRSLGDVASQIRDLAERARTGRIKQHEIEGGSFTVSNLGMYGTSEFAAIINPPHAGILAVGATEQRAVVVDGAVTVASMMTVTLSADHRVLDGALAAQWLAAFVRRIESPVTILV